MRHYLVLGNATLAGSEEVRLFSQAKAFWNKRSHGTKSAMLEDKLIIIPAQGHSNEGQSSLTG